ncbi:MULTISPECIES: S1C family serine protease [Pseudomonas]|uniref:S1C family serine protease n=1 Tax=Pseudomonas TaxID=286 RepID=UPI0012390590|nr:MULTISPECIES: trypsin-like peptidase domain-containing protein [Pseudomonas]QIB51036.1 PDZ domain-containing protein [Pseudomonas sp. OIL-1]
MKDLVRNLAWPVACGLLAALLIVQKYPHWLGLPEKSNVAIQVAPQAAAPSVGPASYSDAVQRAAPAVASIFTSKELSETNGQPRAPTLRDYSDTMPAPARRQSSLGSAVILSPDGYLLTNNHVIADADEILVALQDGREALARLIGTDPETDLAVLKIDLPNLPAVTISSNDELRQRTGDVVMAIGNPFGLGQTVTMGIISATGRNQLGLNTYEDFIQTDAAINQGNSGGALIDAHGNLIGINTAIFSQSGGSQGIGFAIPARLAYEVMQEIIAAGRVIRGWLGVEVQPVTPDLAASYNLKQSEGIVITGLYRDGPAWQAGLQPGDLILRIDEQPASSGRDAMNQVARADPGEKVTMEVMRDGKKHTFVAQVGVRPSFKP